MSAVKPRHEKQIIETVKDIIMHSEYNTWISIFDINSEGAPIDIETSIFKALGKGKGTFCQT